MLKVDRFEVVLLCRITVVFLFFLKNVAFKVRNLSVKVTA